MSAKKQPGSNDEPTPRPAARQERSFHGRILSPPDQDKVLDAVQLHRLEQSFRDWSVAASRSDVRVSRKRILLIFLLIRYTAAKLSEVLGVDPIRDIDLAEQAVHFGRTQAGSDRPRRTVHLPAAIGGELETLIADADIRRVGSDPLNMDPGFVRRKFYERAEACGIAKQLAAPEVLRRSRAVELMQNNMPLPAVQMLLGHSTPNLTSSYLSFSEDDLRQATRFYLEKESARKTSARNSFFGKIQSIQQGDIQSRVELVTLAGHRIATIITNDSLQRLGLKAGRMITAEVKAPWVTLHKGNHVRDSSADNVFESVVERIHRGRINTEYIVTLSDGTEVCSIVTSESCRRLALGEGDRVWVAFNGFAVVLLAD